MSNPNWVADRVVINVDELEKKLLDEVCEKEGRTRTQVLRRLIRQYLQTSS